MSLRHFIAQKFISKPVLFSKPFQQIKRFQKLQTITSIVDQFISINYSYGILITGFYQVDLYEQTIFIQDNLIKKTSLYALNQITLKGTNVCLKIIIFKRLAYTLAANCYRPKSVTQPDASSKRYMYQSDKISCQTNRTQNNSDRYQLFSQIFAI